MMRGAADGQIRSNCLMHFSLAGIVFGNKLDCAVAKGHMGTAVLQAKVCIINDLGNNVGSVCPTLWIHICCMSLRGAYMTSYYSSRITSD